MKLLGICGSLRKASYNAALLRACGELLPAGSELTIFERLAEVPPYNDDVLVAGFPEPVEVLRRQIREADALLFVSPEYNFSIPGLLKNAIDWASRPPDQPFARKPIGLMGASPGMIGTARGQYHIRQVFVMLDGAVLNKPEVFVSVASQKFDEDGVLTDQPTRDIVAQLLAALKDHASRMRAYSSAEGAK